MEIQKRIQGCLQAHEVQTELRIGVPVEAPASFSRAGFLEGVT